MLNLPLKLQLKFNIPLFVALSKNWNSADNTLIIFSSIFTIPKYGEGTFFNIFFEGSKINIWKDQWEISI